MINKVFPILGGAAFSSMLGAGIIAPILPLYADSLQATGTWIGMIFAGFSLSRAILTPIIGRLSDHSGRRKLFLCAGLFIYAAISLAYISADSSSHLLIVRLLHGSAAGAIIPIAQAYIGDLSPAGKEGTWMGYFNAAFFTGFGFGFLFGGVLTDHFGMASTFIAMGSLNMLAFIFALIFLPEDRKTKEALSQRGKPISTILKNKVIAGILSFHLMNAAGRGIFSCFIPLAAALQGMSPSQTGTALAANILLMSSLHTFSGRLADRVSRKKLIIAGGLVDVLMFSLVLLVESFPQLLALCVLGSIGRAMSLPSASAMIVQQGKKYGMGSVMGLFTMAMSAGMVLGPVLGGKVMDSWEISMVFLVGALMELIGTGLFAWLTR